MHKPVRVLFLCDGRSARSRMAEGLLRSQGGDGFEVYSAGIEAEELNLFAKNVMKESNIDISDAPISQINDFEDIQFDYVITLCEEAEKNCLAFPRDGHNLHWTCIDPGEKKGDEEHQRIAYRQARDTLKQQVDAWLKSLA